MTNDATTSRDGRSGVTPLLIVLVALLLLLGIGWPLGVRVGLIPAPPAPPTSSFPSRIAPVAGPRPSVTTNRSAMYAMQMYKLKEGDAKRGPLFQALATQLMNAVPNFNQMSVAEMMTILGPPDYVAGGGPAGGAYAYLYDRFGKQDWAVYVTADGSGHVIQFGVNGVSPGSWAGWQKYASSAAPGAAAATQATAQATTEPSDE